MLRRASPLLLLITALAGCPKAPPAVTMPPKPEVKIPTGCEARLAGDWVHSRDPSFRYTATDDGTTLVLEALRTPATSTDGTEVEEIPSEAEDARAQTSPVITLERSPRGFRGATVAEQYLPDGQRCEVPYPTEVISCTGSTLTLSTATFVAVDVECRVAPTTEESPREQHRLERAKSDSAAAQGGSKAPSQTPPP